MSTARFGSILLLGFSLACGGSTPAAETAGHGEHAGHAEHAEQAHHEEHGGEHGEDEHPDLPPALDAFHEAFAAHWHGDRTGAAVCPDAANLQTLAHTAGEENGDAEIMARTDARATAVVELCAAADHGEAFDAALMEMHHSLHELME